MSHANRVALGAVLALALLGAPAAPAFAAAPSGPSALALEHAWWLVDHDDAGARGRLWLALGTAYKGATGSAREALLAQLMARWRKPEGQGASSAHGWLQLAPPSQALSWADASTRSLNAEALVGQVLLLPAAQVRAEGSAAAFVVAGGSPTAIARVGGRPGMSWAGPPANYLVRVREAARTSTSFGPTLALKADLVGVASPSGLSLDGTMAEALAREWLAGAPAGEASSLANELAGRRKAMASQAMWKALRARDHAGLSEALASGAEPDATDAQGDRPLLAALRLGDGTAVEALLARRAKAEVSDGRGLSALMLAAVAGQSGWVRRLAAAGAKLDTKSPVFAGGPDLGPLLASGQESALSLAARAGRSEVCRTLVELGASPTQGNAHGDTPLHIAVARLDLATLRAMLASRTDPDTANAKGLTPLMLLASLPLSSSEQATALAVAEALLGAGADPQRSGLGGRSAAALAEANPLATPAIRMRLGQAAQPLPPGSVPTP